jgi:hypothetical protein
MDEGWLIIPSGRAPNKHAPGLLAKGEHGAHPPYAFQWQGKWITPSTVVLAAKEFWGGGASIETKPEALVLAWNGEPVADGMDRLLRALKGRPKKNYTMKDVESAAFSAQVEGVGTIIKIPVTP